MRNMKYYLPLNKDEGYIIANTNVAWDTMPTPESYRCPPIKITSVFLYDEAVDLAPYVRLGWDFEDDLESEAEAEFEKNYALALRGELKGWKLVGIRVNDILVTMMFAHQEADVYKVIYLCPPRQTLRIMLETERADGGTDRYLLTAFATDDQQEFIQVTEYGSFGCREICFTGFHTDSYPTAEPGKAYFYVQVTEHC